jgi:hypothetical protein
VNRAPAWQRAVMTGVFSFELVALWSDLPTISEITRKHPWLAGLIVGGLAFHFMPENLS